MDMETTTSFETKLKASRQEILPDSPGVIVFPPVLPLGSLALGLTLHFFLPVHLFASGWPRIAGAVLAAVCIIVGWWAIAAMKRAETNVRPNQPALAIVTDGPFRFSRNPIYVANSIVYLGLALAFDTAWPLFLFVPMMMVLYWGIILREERYLEAKFGEAYLEYKTRVRRWL